MSRCQRLTGRCAHVYMDCVLSKCIRCWSIQIWTGFTKLHYKKGLQTKINIKNNKLWTTRTHAYFSAGDRFSSFLAFDFCRFCVVIRFFHPRHNGQWPPTSNDFLSQIVSITFIFLSWFLRKSQYFPFQCTVLNKGTTWYHFYNVFCMTRSLTGDWTQDLPHSMPARYH